MVTKYQKLYLANKVEEKIFFIGEKLRWKEATDTTVVLSFTNNEVSQSVTS